MNDEHAIKLFNMFLELIKKFEGGKLHRNSGETDITTGYGIYRAAHPNATVFQVYDLGASKLGITSPSSEWTKEEISMVNDLIEGKDADPELNDLMIQKTKEFYNAYFSKATYEGVPSELSLAYKLIYINSNKIANKALQSTYNLAVKIAGYNKQLKVDGIVGSGSKQAFKEFKEFIDYHSEVINVNTLLAIFISYCKSFYIDISTDEVNSTGTDKHLKYLNGWDNRCNTILESYVF